MKYEFHELANIFPLMNERDVAELAEDIARNGQREPIYLYDGKILDGRNRYNACARAGVAPRFEHYDGDAPLEFVVSLNLHRRHLDESQRAMAAARIATLRHGGDRKSNQAANLQLDNITTHKAAEMLNVGERSAYNARKVLNEGADELIEAVEQGDIAVSRAAGYASRSKDEQKEIVKAYKEIKRNEQQQKRQVRDEERARLAELGASTPLTLDLRLGDFEDVLRDVADGSADCIITDPPYPYEHIEQWTKLSRFARRVLKPNGYCIAYSGQMHLPEVMRRMNEHLDYYWTFAVYHSGGTQIVNGVNLMCRWKPVLIYQNGKKKLSDVVQDYFISEQREKGGHDWQQSESGVDYLVEKFTAPGDLVLEPFAGAATTMRVCRDKGRRVIGAEIDENTYNIARALL